MNLDVLSVEGISEPPISPQWRRRTTLSISSGDALHSVIKQLDQSNDAVIGIGQDTESSGGSAAMEDSNILHQLYVLDRQPGDHLQSVGLRQQSKRGRNWPNINRDESIHSVVKRIPADSSLSDCIVLNPFNSADLLKADYSPLLSPSLILALPVNVLKPLCDSCTSLDCQLTLTLRDTSGTQPLIALLGPNAARERSQMVTKSLLPTELFKPILPDVSWQIEVQVNSYPPSLFEDDPVIGDLKPYALVSNSHDPLFAPHVLPASSDVESEAVDDNNPPSSATASVEQQLFGNPGKSSYSQSQKSSQVDDFVTRRRSIQSQHDFKIDYSVTSPGSDEIIKPQKRVEGTTTNSSAAINRPSSSAILCEDTSKESNVEDPFLKILMMQGTEDKDDFWDADVAGMQGYDTGLYDRDPDQSSQVGYRPPVIVGDQLVDDNISWGDDPTNLYF
eukprot:GHVH01011355.1.p1 GENE.GHVH01011355.1~~GHVH01011355.1.p1  ORF type:complete len:448 (+),score=60.09 GHVH01011355.1:434-1777(+)